MVLSFSLSSLLVNAGLLIRGREEEEGYWFAIPNAGFFLKACTKGRQEVVGLLKRQKHKELLQEEIENKRLRTSFLGPMFHVKDLIGQGILERYPSHIHICTICVCVCVCALILLYPSLCLTNALAFLFPFFSVPTTAGPLIRIVK